MWHLQPMRYLIALVLLSCSSRPPETPPPAPLTTEWPAGWPEAGVNMVREDGTVEYVPGPRLDPEHAERRAERDVDDAAYTAATRAAREQSHAEGRARYVE